MNNKDFAGTNRKDCPNYNKGLCASEQCKNPGHEICIGTRLCDVFWEWFIGRLKELYPNGI